MSESTGKIVVISGPSGVGKSTIVRMVLERIPEAILSISLTTRAKSNAEQHGIDYWFVSREEFQQQLLRGELLEYAEVFGNFYGTPKDKIDELAASGKIVILEIDVQGAKQVKMIYPDAQMIFILPPDQKILFERLNGRGREDEATARKRLERADHEIAAAWQYYEHMVINDDLEQAVKEVSNIIQSSIGDRK